MNQIQKTLGGFIHTLTTFRGIIDTIGLIFSMLMDASRLTNLFCRR